MNIGSPIRRPVAGSQKIRLILVIALTLLGAFVRIAYQKGRSFTGDEVGTLIFMGCSPRYLLTHYGIWVSMNYYILGLKVLADVFGRNPWVLTAPSLLANVAAIPLTYLVGKRFAPPGVAAMAAAIIAFNPYVIEFAPIIRAYSIHLSFTLLCVLLYLRWRDARTWRRGCAFALASLLMCLNHMVGIYTAAAICILEVACLARDFKSRGVRAIDARWSLLIPMIGVIAVLAISISLYYPELKLTNAEYTCPRPGNVSYLVPMFALYFGGEYAGFFYSILLLAGVVAVAQQRLVRLEAAAFIVAPVVLMVLQGVAHLPGAFARFDIGMLPYLALLIAAGISFIAGWLPSGIGPWAGGAMCAIVLAGCGAPELIAMQREKSEKPWARVQKYLAATIQPGDEVVGSIVDVIAVAGPFLETRSPLAGDIPQINSSPSGMAAITGPNSFRDSPVALFTMPLFVALPDSAVVSHKVYFITSDAKIRSGAPQHREGKITVCTYGGSKTEILEKMASDLAATTDNRTEPKMISYYLMLQVLSNQLGRPADAEHYRAMALDCVLRMEQKERRLPYSMPGVYG